MDKVKFVPEYNEAAQRWKEQTFQSLIKNHHIQEWLKANQLPESFIYEHTGRFADWVKHVERCDHCQGLAYCTQPIRGQYADLYMDQFLNLGIHRCSYYKEHEQALAHGAYYLDPKVSEAQLTIDLGKLNTTNESNAYKNTLVRVVDFLAQEHPSKGLYFWGKPGAGKSFLAVGIVNHYAKKKIPVAFMNTAQLISDLKMMFHDHEAMEARLRNIRNAAVLVLDDIGGESVTAWSRDDILFPLLDARMEQQRLTLFTSNYNLNDLKVRYAMNGTRTSEPMAAERLIERIRTLADEEFVKGESRRK